ncbi:MAG: histidine phosphatase family protein [Elusimicrobia bacterium]|nr:histidine phosphatase family protein [Elusimicrobiota bacterium]
MRLFLVRHGNTFNDGEKVVAVGARQDLPLTDKGRLQAKAFGQKLLREKIKPVAVFCSPLKRTKEFAQIALTEAELAVTPIVTETLREIDYGGWTGKTDESIQKEFGYESWRAWQEESRWPDNAGWKPTQQEVINSINELARTVAISGKRGQNVVLVGSNGVLRFFLKLPEGEWDERVQNKSFKIGTGRYGELHYEGGRFFCVSWNKEP